MHKPALSKSAFAGAAMLVAALTIALGLNASLRAQAAAQGWERADGGGQEFEVASVRKNTSGGQSNSNFSLDNGNAYFTAGKDDALNPNGTLFSAKSQTLLRYIVFAYKLGGTQELALRFDFYAGLGLHVSEWVRNDRYDIDARTPGAATKDQMRLMMQSLLAERFKLAVHWETREAPVFALVLDRPGKLGPQLRQHPAGDDCSTTAFPENSGKNAPAAPPLAAIPIPCGLIAHLPASAPGENHFGGRNVTLTMLAESMPTQTGLNTLPRPLIDETGLTGGFDFSIEWTPEDTSQAGELDSFGAAFREALKEQLGLKLEPQKGPVLVLVIDHVEQPSPN
jgi:uncharacterized protein (TIGR03435 family)